MADKIMTYQEMQKMLNGILKGLDKTNKDLAETNKAIDKTNKGMEENKRETEKLIKSIDKTNKSIDAIGKSNGIVAETSFYEATEEGITVDGIFFKQTAVNFVVYDGTASKAEIDILMDNGKYILLIETKYRLSENHINSFKKKIGSLQKYNPKAVKGKKILTAFATMGINKVLTKTFNDAGHYVITAKNNRIHISSPTGITG